METRALTKVNTQEGRNKEETGEDPKDSLFPLPRPSSRTSAADNQSQNFPPPLMQIHAQLLTFTPASPSTFSLDVPFRGDEDRERERKRASERKRERERERESESKRERAREKKRERVSESESERERERERERARARERERARANRRETTSSLPSNVCFAEFEKRA